MVKPRKRIAKRPNQASTDEWVSQGGLDPEIQKTHEVKAEDEENSKKKYPHRISFDMETSQYKRLKRAAFDEDCPMNEILREAVNDWLEKRNY